MEKEKLFKWKHYQPDIILLTVRWYLRYNLSFRDLVEMMEERGLSIAHTTIMRWVHQYGPELDARVRRHLKLTNDSWRIERSEITMEASTFLGLFWGWVIVIVSGILFVRPSVLRELKKLVVEDRGFGIMYGFLSIFLGLGTVILHNVWALNWQGFITVIAWLALLKGIYVIAYPEPSKKTNFEVRILSTRIVLAIIGALALWMLVIIYMK